MVFLEGISSVEEDGYSLRTRRNECVGIEYRMVFAIVGGGIYDGFFQFTRGDGSACGVLYMGVYPKPFTDVMDVSVAELLKHVAQSKLP